MSEMDYLSVTPKTAAEDEIGCTFEVVDGDTRYPCHCAEEGHTGPHLIDADVVEMLVRHNRVWRDRIDELEARVAQLSSGAARD